MNIKYFHTLCTRASFILCLIFRSHIGKAILSQPACVSKLLSLLLDQRPSPKLVLIILQLCRAALPLMSVEDCGNVALPSWSYSINTLDAEQQDANDPASRIAALLLAKLADYVVPGWFLNKFLIYLSRYCFLLISLYNFPFFLFTRLPDPALPHLL